MGTKYKGTFREMEEEIVWGTTCTPANQIYDLQTPGNSYRWITNLTTMETTGLSKAECLDQKRSTEHLKYLLLRRITMA